MIKFLKKIKYGKKGFTIIETIVSLGLVATVLTLSTGIFVNVMNLTHKSDYEAKMRSQMQTSLSTIQHTIQNASCIEMSNTALLPNSSCSMSNLCPAFSTTASNTNLVAYYLSDTTNASPVVYAAVFNSTLLGSNNSKDYYQLEYSLYHLSGASYLPYISNEDLIGDSLSNNAYKFELTVPAGSGIFNLNCGNGVVRPFITVSMQGMLMSQIAGQIDIGPVEVDGEAELENYNY